MFIMPNAELTTFQQQRKNYFSEFINSAALFRSMNSSGIMPKSLAILRFISHINVVKHLY